MVWKCVNVGRNFFIRLAMFVCAGISAILFAKLDLPLPWLLGPMVSTICLKWKYPAQIFFSLKVRNVFLIVLGYNIGAYVTIDACKEIMQQFLGINVATLASILISVAIAYWTTKATGASYASSVIGTMPGGITPMLLICENIPRADINVVAVLQSIRLIGTIAVVPFLVSHGFGTDAVVVIQEFGSSAKGLDIPAWQLVLVAVSGGIIGRLAKMPAEFLLGPILSTGIFAIYTGANLPDAPIYLINIAQIATGIYLGTCIDPFQVTRNHKLLPVGIIGVIVALVTNLYMGYLLSMFFGFSITTAFLACAPGGIAEMCIMGMVLGENVPIILAYQLFRLFILNFIMPIALKWYFTK